VRVEYARSQGSFEPRVGQESAKAAESAGAASETAVGDFAGAFASAPVKLDATYTTADEIPFDDRAACKRRRLDRRPAHALDVQPDDRVDGSRRSQDAGIPREKVRVSSPFIGGGFGAKLWLRADALLAALGARAARRPVRIAMPRALIPNNTVHRSATIQRIRIGASRDGKITAIAHESWSHNLPEGGPEAASIQTRSLYAGPHRMTSNRLAVLDLPEANADARAERSAGTGRARDRDDEMAEKLGMDPIEFRIAN
jgi:xanthine dehydrogenase YagR molybdenum-binding subunit